MEVGSVAEVLGFPDSFLYVEVSLAAETLSSPDSWFPGPFPICESGSSCRNLVHQTTVEVGPAAKIQSPRLL